MKMRAAWINREKVLLVLSGGLLVVAGAVLFCSKPCVHGKGKACPWPEALTFLKFGECVNDPGEHRVAVSAPGALNIGLDDLATSEKIDPFLAGARSNPFSLHTGFAVAPTPHVPVPSPNPNPRPVPIPPPPPPPNPGGNTPSTQPVKTYEVPVDFRGILATDGGQMFVLLKVKTSGENRRLAEGDVWPETGLRIVKITQSSVMLENEKGDKFLMRDLYSRKAAAEDGG